VLQQTLLQQGLQPFLSVSPLILSLRHPWLYFNLFVVGAIALLLGSLLSSSSSTGQQTTAPPSSANPTTTALTTSSTSSSSSTATATSYIAFASAAVVSSDWTSVLSELPGLGVEPNVESIGPFMYFSALMNDTQLEQVQSFKEASQMNKEIKTCHILF
jgi:hypothetical protein